MTISEKQASGIPIRIEGDSLPLGRLYISHRQMWLEFPTGVARRVVEDLFPGAQIEVDEERYTADRGDLIIKARIVGFVWRPKTR
jgi:hypothetical protein